MSRRSGVPRYLRPAPDRVLALPRPVWTCVVTAALLVLVESAARSGAVTPLQLVPVETMVQHAGALLGDGTFLVDDLLHSVVIILLSFAIGAVLGVAVALVMYNSGWCRSALNPFLAVYYAVPTFALYPIVVVIFGTGSVPIVITSAAFGVVAVTVKSIEGFDSVAPVVSKLARSLQLSRSRYVRTVLLPAAMPDIAAGLKLALGYSIIAVLATEFILSTQGLGWFISQSYNNFGIGDMYGAILIVTGLALVGNLGLALVLRPFDWRRP